MFNRPSFHLPHYFRKHLSLPLEELYISVAVLNLALAAVVLFEPIFLYKLGFGISHIMMYYVVVYGLYYFLLPLGGKFVAVFGTERSMLISSVMLLGYYASLFLLPGHREFFWIAPIFFALQKMWYWPAYHTDFIETSDQGERGKEFSGLWSVSTIVYIVGPILGGIVIKFLGFSALFVFVGLVILLSNIPLFLTPLQPIRREKFSYWNSFSLPFRLNHVRSMLGYLGLGEELIMMTVWPVFIYLAFKDYVSIGGLVTLATLVTAVVSLMVGKWVDNGQERRTLRLGGILTALTWMVRPWLSVLSSVFASDTAGRIFKNGTFVPMTALSYSHALKEHSVVERSVFFEQGFAVAKTLIALLVIVAAHWFPPIGVAFLIAAGFSLMYLLF